jgi:multiple sugar transport system substrate-binding protein
VFLSGEAAFSFNWQYVCALSKNPDESKVVGQVGVAPVPAGPAAPEAHRSTARWRSPSPRSSKHPEEAWQQNSRHLQEGAGRLRQGGASGLVGVPPDPAVVAIREELAKAAQLTFKNMVLRPVIAATRRCRQRCRRACGRALRQGRRRRGSRRHRDLDRGAIVLYLHRGFRRVIA